jgi:transcriptional regulator with XRE-family HTH domain
MPRASGTVPKSSKREEPPEFGRGTGVPDPVDVHVGGRIRVRRLYRGMRQEELARELGLTFQQVQKYESGANRVSASRLWEIAAILETPIAYFFPGKEPTEPDDYPQDQESIELARLYYAIVDPAMRQQLFDMVKGVAAAQPAPRSRRRGI